MVPFLLTGAVLGLILGALIAYVGPDAPSAGPAQEIIALAVPFGLLGGLLGGIVFLLVERFTVRR
jgi:hypothetical protein